MAYLCAIACEFGRKFNIDIGNPPQNPGVDWVTEMADAFFTDPDKNPMSAEERVMSMLGSFNSVSMGGP